MFQSRLILAPAGPKRQFLKAVTRPPALNLALLAMACLLVLSYVILANRLVSERYALTTGKLRLDQANAALAQQNVLNQRQYSLDDLAVFARQVGLIEARDYETLFTDPGLAALNQSGHAVSARP